MQELHQEKGILDTVRHISSYMHSSKQQKNRRKYNAVCHSDRDALIGKSFDIGKKHKLDTLNLKIFSHLKKSTFLST